jgi:short-subunit dehydrogenase
MGSSRGIGRATAIRARAYGATVILHGKTDSENLKKLAKELNSNYIICDVTNRENVHEVILDISGNIDGLIYCTGIVKPKPFLELTKYDTQEEFETNLF